MSNDSTATAPTRRRWIKESGTLAGGLLAGCLSNGDRSDSANGSTSSTNATTTAGHSASIPPVGQVSFDGTPRSWVGGFGFVADVLTALGHGSAVAGMCDPSYWHTGFYDLLDGVSAPATDEIPTIITDDGATNQELLLEINPDVIAIDPNLLLAYYGLNPEDIETLSSSTAPFFGNESRRMRGDSWPNWPTGEAYPYLPLSEYLTRYGQVFDETDRAASIRSFYESTIAELIDRVPPANERPRMALVNGRYNPDNDNGWTIYDPISEIDRVWGKKQYRDLGAVDTFAGQYGGQSRITVDDEALLQADPDVIVFHFGVTFRDLDGTNYVRQQIEYLNETPLTQRITAVEEGALYVGGTPYQGPIVNLFQTEMLAKQLYPGEFGAYPGLGNLTPDEQLFDRTRLASLITPDQ